MRDGCASSGIKKIKAEVVSCRRRAPGVYLLGLKAPYLARRAQPGQFVNVYSLPGVFLPRPFSLHKAAAGVIYLLFNVKGRATRYLSHLAAGKRIELAGPLGRPFEKRDFFQASVQVLVGGGMGAAPLVFLAQKLLPSSHTKRVAFLGADRKAGLLGKKELQKYGFKVYTATLDGSEGQKGDVISLFCQKLKEKKLGGKAICVFGCGPYGMAKSLQRVLKRHKIKGWFSFEAIIACGLGLCRGCAIDTKSGYKLLCQDGPVFDLAEVRFNKIKGGEK